MMLKLLQLAIDYKINIILNLLFHIFILQPFYFHFIKILKILLQLFKIVDFAIFYIFGRNKKNY
jgi:hypothetical protein